MVQICGICKKEFKDNYIGGIRDSVRWKDIIICGSCYNKGYTELNFPKQLKKVLTYPYKCCMINCNNKVKNPWNICSECKRK